MKKQAAPKSTPVSGGDDKKSKLSSVNPQSEFLSAVLSLSWRLAIVVLVPVLGGYKLDEHFHQSPIWTISGFLVAIVGVFLLLRQVLRQLNGEGQK